MNRRAQVLGPLLWNTIGLILVIIFVVGLAILLFRVIGSGSENERAASESSLFSLAGVIKSYSASSEVFLPLENQRDFPVNHLIFLADGFILVGFNQGGEKPVDGCGATETITRPPQCGLNACLCLYTDSVGPHDFDKDDDSPELPISCAVFDDVKTIRSFWYYSNSVTFLGDRTFFEHRDLTVSEKIFDTFLGACYPGTDGYYQAFEGLPAIQFRDGLKACGSNIADLNPYANLVLYGDCGAGDVEFGQEPLYVEKATINGKNHILISAPISSELRLRRQKRVQSFALSKNFEDAQKLFNEGKFNESITPLKKFIDAAKNSDNIELNARIESAEKLLIEACTKIEEKRDECPDPVEK